VKSIASLPAQIPEDLGDVRVVKTMTRYDFSVAVTRVELDVERISS
jgi:hypothetical protein